MSRLREIVTNGPFRGLLAWLLVFGSIGFTLWKADQFDNDADQTGAALCALRGDLERRVETSRQFLRDHPEGIPGIPSKTIQDGINNQRRTIEALSTLSCS